MSNDEIKLIVPKREGQISALFSRGGPRDGAGRKAIGQTKKLSLTLPEPSWAELERQCAERGWSKSEFIRHMLLERFAQTAGKEANE